MIISLIEAFSGINYVPSTLSSIVPRLTFPVYLPDRTNPLCHFKSQASLNPRLDAFFPLLHSNDQRSSILAYLNTPTTAPIVVVIVREDFFLSTGFDPDGQISADDASP